MKRYEVIIIGAGPAGLSAAIEAAKAGLEVVVFDENARPGGQLFKQIHKFFGSKEHQAMTRGFRIGENLLREAEDLGVKVVLNATVLGIFHEKVVQVSVAGKVEDYRADGIIIATGAAENTLFFEGWTTPGVMGAGAAQTLMNLHGVQPGKKILMVGSGNVGLVVSFQLLQAGCEVVALIDAAPRIGGYGVHASKLARVGIPFYTSHTILCAEGGERVSSATIARVDASFQPIAGSEIKLDVDTVCLAVGLSPMSQLADAAGCEMVYVPSKGGNVPELTETGKTSVPGIYCAGDAGGVEEASSAMLQGKICAAALANELGYISDANFAEIFSAYTKSLVALRMGMFGPVGKAKGSSATDEGLALSETLLEKGYLSGEDALRFGKLGGGTLPNAQVHPVVECTQNIPCNACQDVCPMNLIKIGETITALPQIDKAKKCSGCALCVGACSGQAIFLSGASSREGYDFVALPYEFLPLPEKGEKGKALDRSGTPICDASVLEVRTNPKLDKTAVLFMEVPSEFSAEARFFRAE